MTTKMQSCIDHIKTAHDVDPWAMEMVEKIFTEYDKRFDQVLEIIEEKKIPEKYDMDRYDVGWLDAVEAVERAVMRLKGGEQE